jgi:hypothetical protein
MAEDPRGVKMSNKILDTQRLDWLEANAEAGEPILVYHPPSGHITWKISSGDEFDSLRDAIDDAMRTAQPQDSICRDCGVKYSITWIGTCCSVCDGIITSENA